MKQEKTCRNWMRGMRESGALVLSLAVGTAIVPLQNAQAHGAVAKPIARQYQCFIDRGYDDPGNITIPRPDCRAAYHAVPNEGHYPFQQWNEVAANPHNQGQDMADVRRAVPDGLLCAGGDPRKRGLDQVATPWAPQMAKLDAQGRLEVRWDLTQPHNPAVLRVFLSKPSYDGSRALRWDDLEEVYNAPAPAPAPANPPGMPHPTYTIKVPIPAGREGKAVLYNYWQRQDAGNEGFFNCSDINIDRNGGGDPGFPWIEEKPYLPGFTPKAGDSVRFRVMGGDAGSAERTSGIERVDITWPINAANAANHVWAGELAEKLNNDHALHVRIGVLQGGARSRGTQKAKEIVFDRVNLATNRIWLKDGYSSAFSLDTGGPVEPGDHWRRDAVGSYKQGSTVIGLDGATYTCVEAGWCGQAVPATWADKDWPYAAGSAAAHREGHPAWKPAADTGGTGRPKEKAGHH